MPLQNRVTPFSTIIADLARGSWMGNRGCIHRDDGSLYARTWVTRGWITCLLEFKGRRVPLREKGYYTPLFFLDEATAFAAGHRPCAECRRQQFNDFKAAWLRAFEHPSDAKLLATEIDEILHGERIDADNKQKKHPVALDELPTGAMITLDDAAIPYLVLEDTLLRWSPAGYTEKRARPRGIAAMLLTPPSFIKTFKAGYAPQLHWTAQKPLSHYLSQQNS